MRDKGNRGEKGKDGEESKGGKHSKGEYEKGKGNEQELEKIIRFKKCLKQERRMEREKNERNVEKII